MERPFAKPFGFAESLLGDLCGLALSRSVDLQDLLADLGLPTVIAEHIFHEADEAAGANTLRQIAEALNARGIPTARGG